MHIHMRLCAYSTTFEVDSPIHLLIFQVQSYGDTEIVLIKLVINCIIIAVVIN